MDKETFFTHFFNGQSIEQVASAFAWGLIGLIGSTILEIIRSTSKIKSKGGFRFGHWMKDNFYRLILGVFIIFIGAAYGTELIGKVSEMGALGLGFVTDKIIEALLKLKRTLNLKFSGNSDADKL